MPILSRPAKQGGVSTYQEKVAQGYKTILASEADADLNTIYDAWNTGVDAVNIQPGAITADKLAPNQIGPRELADNLPGSILAADAISARELGPDSVATVEILNGSVTQAKLAADANLWTDTGSVLRPTSAARPVALGSATVKGTLEASATGLTILASNRASAPNDLTKPSWAVQLDPTFNAFQVAYRAANAAANSQSFPLTVNAQGKTICTLENASVQKAMLAPGAAMQTSGLFTFAAGANIAPGNWVGLGTVTLTTRGGPVLVWIVSGLVAWHTAAGEFYVGASRDVAQTANPTVYNYVRYPALANTSPPVPTFLWLDVPPAGSHSYYANFYITGGNIVGAPATPGFMAAVELS